MFDFVHHKVNTFTGFMNSFNNLQRLLAVRSYSFETEFDVFQKSLLKHFESTGKSNKEAEIQKLYNLLLTVKRGFDPVKLEKINIGKREAYWGFAYHCTENIHQIISEILSKEQKKLDEAEEILSNTILNLYQLKILDDKKLKQLNSIEKIGKFWNDLIKKNDSISLIDKKLRMQLLQEDIYLIIEKLVNKII